ncbi:hypothetical protein S83_062552 [Arachis hypogaea]
MKVPPKRHNSITGKIIILLQTYSLTRFFFIFPNIKKVLLDPLLCLEIVLSYGICLLSFWSSFCSLILKAIIVLKFFASVGHVKKEIYRSATWCIFYRFSLSSFVVAISDN